MLDDTPGNKLPNVITVKDRILLLCVEVGLELENRQVSSAPALGAVPHPALRGVPEQPRPASRKVSKT